jgi:uncharacterized protein
MLEEAWIMTAAILAAAGVIKGLTGIGYATCAIPMLAFLFGLKEAMTLVILPTLAVNLIAVVSTERPAATCWRFWPLLISLPAGVALGLLISAMIDPRHASVLLGACLIGYAIFAVSKPAWRITEMWERALRVPVGILTGTLAGLTGAQILPLAPYFLSLEGKPGKAIGAINISVLIVTGALGVGFWFQGMSNQFEVAVFGGIGPALAGVGTGMTLQSRINAPALRTLIFIVLGCAGVRMVLS